MKENNLRVGDFVEIRSPEEIRTTLDARGFNGGLPFTEEMWQYCGKQYRIFRRAAKVCVEGTLLRYMKGAFFLEDLRCNGSYHEGCDRACLFFWKEAWLRKVTKNVHTDLIHPASSIEEPPRPTYEQGGKYSCQSTSLMSATTPLSRWDLGQYIVDVTSGNFTIGQVLKALIISIYNRVSRTTGHLEYGAIIGNSSKTPSISLNLQPGELVEVKSKEEIAATVDKYGKNRGLSIDYEMLQHAGKQFQVLKRVEKIVLETTGEVREIENTVLLNGTACEGLCRRACARNSHPMWREVWLKRVDKESIAGNEKIRSRSSSVSK